jgi:hypothetical protein
VRNATIRYVHENILLITYQDAASEFAVNFGPTQLQLRVMDEAVRHSSGRNEGDVKLSAKFMCCSAFVICNSFYERCLGVLCSIPLHSAYGFARATFSFAFECAQRYCVV